MTSTTTLCTALLPFFSPALHGTLLLPCYCSSILCCLPCTFSLPHTFAHTLVQGCFAHRGLCVQLFVHAGTCLPACPSPLSLSLGSSACYLPFQLLFSLYTFHCVLCFPVIITASFYYHLDPSLHTFYTTIFLFLYFSCMLLPPATIFLFITQHRSYFASSYSRCLLYLPHLHTMPFLPSRSMGHWFIFLFAFALRCHHFSPPLTLRFCTWFSHTFAYLVSSLSVFPLLSGSHHSWLFRFGHGHGWFCFRAVWQAGVAVLRQHF